MSSQEYPPAQLKNFRLWQCGQCENYFATRNIEDTNSCPECGSVTLTAAEEEYDAVQQ